MQSFFLNDDYFTISNGMLRQYKHRSPHVTVPEGVDVIDDRAFEGRAVISVTLPAGVMLLSRFAFAECAALEKINFPESIKGIMLGAFMGCRTLTWVTLPKNLTDLGSGAFARCERLVTATLNRGINSIGSGAFAGCVALKQAVIPASVTRMGERVFENCNSLECIYCEAPSRPAGWKEDWDVCNKETGKRHKVVWNYGG